MRLALATVLLAVLAVFASPAAGAVPRTPYRVVVFGDSFGAGEGAPGTPGDYGDDGTGTSNRADWGGTAADAEFTNEESETVLNGPRRCHRSPKATAAAAARSLVPEFPDLDLDFHSFACSGARVDLGVVESYKAVEPSDRDNPVPSQISRANSYLNSLPSSTRRIDALVMNIGGNNLGFGDIIAACIGLPFGHTTLQNPTPEVLITDCQSTADAIVTFGYRQERPEKAGLVNLPAVYADLDARIDRTVSSGAKLAKKPRTVFLTGAPNPLAGNYDGCATEGPYDFENGQRLNADERAFLISSVFPRLNQAFQTAASTHGWKFVPMEAAVPFGACNLPDHMYNRNRDALRTQGATINASLGINVSHGIFHPNPLGYAAMEPVMATELRKDIIARFTPTEATVEPAMNPVIELKPRVEVQVRQNANLDFPTRPAAFFPDVATTPTAGGVGDGIVEVPVSATLAATNFKPLRALACGPVGQDAAGVARGCGPSRLVVGGALIGTPSNPTKVTAAADPLGIKATWTKGSSAPLRRFVVEVTARRTFVRGSSGPDPELVGTEPGAGPGPPAGGFLQDEVTLTTTQQYSFEANVREAVVPLAGSEYSVRVRECTDRGCSSGKTAGFVKPPEESLAVTSLKAALGRRFIRQQRADTPVGVFSLRTNLKPVAGRPFPLLLSWGTWTGWTDLDDLTLRFRGRGGLLGEARLDVRSGKISLAAPGKKSRSGRLGAKGSLTAGSLTLDLRGARIVNGGPTSRLIALRLPTRFTTALRGQRVDVEIGASTKKGVSQPPAWTGSLNVRR